MSHMELPVKSGAKKTSVFTLRITDELMTMIREVRDMAKPMRIDVPASAELAIQTWVKEMKEALLERSRAA